MDNTNLLDNKNDLEISLNESQTKNQNEEQTRKKSIVSCSTDFATPRKRWETIASLHSKTQILGDHRKSMESCPCCNTKIPLQYSWSKSFSSNELLHIGLDITNFNSIKKLFMKYLKYFWIFYTIVLVICIIVNLSNFTVFKQKIVNNIGWNFYSADLFVQCPNFYLYVTLPFMILLILLFINISSKIEINRKKYRIFSNSNNLKTEETLFSIFVKNLPKLTDEDDLKYHLESEYNLKINKIIMLKDFQLLEKLNNKLDGFNFSCDYTNEIIRQYSKQFELYSTKIENNGAAIVIFENCDDKLIHFRNYFNLKQIFYIFFAKRIFIYRGNKIYFEATPALNMIDWQNTRYSLEKTMSDSKLRFTISLICSVAVHTLSLGLIFLTSAGFFSFNIPILDAFIKNIFLLGLNALLKFSLELIINSFRLSDLYFKEILKSYYIAKRNTDNIVYTYLLIYTSSNFSDNYYTILFLILFQNVKLAFYSRFGWDYWKRLLTYKIFKNKKFNSQEAVNSILADNEFNFMSSFEALKISFYFTVFIMFYSFTLGLISSLCFYLLYCMVNVSFTRSRFGNLSSYIYGFYFNYTFKNELISLFKFSIIYIFSLAINDNAFGNKYNFSVFYPVIANGLTELIADIGISKQFYKKYYSYDKYSNIKFSRKFDDENFVNVELYMKTICTKISNLEKKKF